MPENRVGEVLEQVPGAAIAVDRDGRFVDGNESSAVVFGTAVDELVGSDLDDLVAAGYMTPAVHDAYESVLSGGDAPTAGEADPDGADSRAASQDGETVDGRFRTEIARAGSGAKHTYEVQVTAAGGSFDGTIWSLTDLSTHQRYADTVEALHRATRRLMEAESGRAVYERAGEAANEVLGFPGVGLREYDSETETLEFVTFGGRVEDIDSRPSYDVDDSPHGRAFRTGETVVQSISDDGDAFERGPFSHTMYVPIGDYGVLSLGKVGGSFDDADQRFAEILANNTEAALRQNDQRERLREQRRRLRRQNERLEEFASIVSHDLRNPLALAKGAFETYRREDDDSQAETVEYALDRMERIVEEVLTMARNGDAVESPAAVSLGAAARDAWRAVETGDLVLSAPDDVTVEADRDRLLRVLENLYRNTAEHATGGEDGATTVTVGVTDDGFAVADDGPGLPEDDPFEAGYTTSHEGTGFGLAIVERIAGAHGWSVRAAESDDGGATFVFEGVERVDS